MLLLLWIGWAPLPPLDPLEDLDVLKHGRLRNEVAQNPPPSTAHPRTDGSFTHSP